MLELCPCGLTGFPECDESVLPLTNISLALEKQCFSEETGECIVEEDRAFCDCECGHGGVFCEIPGQYTVGNLGAAYIVVVILTAVPMLAMIWRRGSIFTHLQQQDFVTSNLPFVSPAFIFVYRALVTVGMLVVTGIFIVPDPYQLLFFTIWSWLVAVFMMSVGCWLSFKAVFFGVKDGPATSVEKAYYVLLEITLPAALILDVITWGLLLPTAEENGNRDELLSLFGFIVHAVNAVILLLEFFLNEVYFDKLGVCYLVIYLAVYSFYHTTLMIAADLRGDGHCPLYPFLNMEEDAFVPAQGILLLTFAGGYFICYALSVLKKKSRRKKEPSIKEDMK